MGNFARADLIWVAILAIISVVVGRFFWGFGWGTTIVAVLLVSLGRLAYAWYAHRPFRR